MVYIGNAFLEYVTEVAHDIRETRVEVGPAGYITYLFLSKYHNKHWTALNEKKNKMKRLPSVTVFRSFITSKVKDNLKIRVGRQ